MTATFQAAGDRPAHSPISRLWNRQLDRYPNNGARFLSLGIVVATTVVLYYQLYLAGGVAIQILGDLHMSFLFYVNTAVVGYVFGAIASVVAGLADRYGRANIVTAGLLLTGVLSLAVLPNMHSKIGFAIAFTAIGFVEGIVLVATPALIRDFSPQLGRASAMGFWTLGPVLGSLVVSAIVTNTSSHTWQWQYVLAGIIGLVVFLIALVGLRELAPNLRDQLMVSQKDRALIEARAKGLDIEDSLKHPFRQMLKLDIVGSAFAISVFLTIYFIAVGFFPLFFETVFGYSPAKANGLGNYFWACDAGALLIVGALSDLTRVRKPFMILGAVGAIVFTTLFTLTATKSGTTHGTFVLLLIGMSVCLGIAFAPWMASFTETVERRNPALTATGLAVWGLVIRIVVAVIAVIAPHIVTAVTPLTQVGTIQADGTSISTAAGATTVGAVVTAVAANPTTVAQIQAQGTQYKAQLTTAAAIDPATSAALTAGSTAGPVVSKAVSDIATTLHVSQAEATTQLVALAKVPKSVLSFFSTTAPKTLGPANFEALTAVGTPAGSPGLTNALATLSKQGPAIAKAQKDGPKQWQHYFWFGVGGQVVFIPLVFLMAGFWSPRKARQAEREHEAMVAAEMAKLQNA